MKKMNVAVLAFGLFAMSVVAGCAGGGSSATRSEARPADVPAVDMASSTKVTEGGETYWKHAPTADDTAYLSSKTPLNANWVTLYVNGLGCPLCATNIDKQLERLPGIEWMYVDLGHGVVQMKLAHGESKLSPMKLNDTVLDAGFTLVKIRTQ